jgi:hypothetical protein
MNKSSEGVQQIVPIGCVTVEDSTLIGFRTFENKRALYTAGAHFFHVPQSDDPHNTQLEVVIDFVRLDNLPENLPFSDSDGSCWLDATSRLAIHHNQPLREQFVEIMRQLARLSDDELRQWLDDAKDGGREQQSQAVLTLTFPYPHSEDN